MHMFINARFFTILTICILLANTHTKGAALAPTTPTIAINGASIIIPPAVSLQNNIFTIVACAGSNSTYATHSSDNGSTWTSYVTGPGGVTRPILVASNSTGILATWSNSSGQAYSSFSTNNGATWSSPVSITTNSIQPVGVCSIQNNFIATWQGIDANAYAAFTSNNGTTWNSPVTISNSGTIGSAVIACANNAGTIVATWRSSSSNAYASVSRDNGATWSSPSTISASGNINADVWCAVNKTGFLTTWRTSTNNAYSSFSTDGITWSTPIQIASSVISGAPIQDVSVAATTNGFVSAWVKSDNNVYASFLANESSTWSTPIAVSSGGNVAALNAGYSLGLWHPFIGIATNNNTCMFTWDQTDANVRTSYSLVSNSIDSAHNLRGTQLKNDFGITYEYCNVLAWDPSSASNILGYSIYKNSVLVANVSAQTTTFIDHNQSKNATTTYSVQPFDIYDNTGPLTSVLFDHSTVSAA